MRWPWRRRTPPDRRLTSDDVGEATAARRRAEEQLRQAVEQTAEVQHLAEQLRRHRRINHFAELFGQSFEGGRKW